MPKYKAPEGVTGINIGGQQFNADEKGVIAIPDEGSYQMPPGYELATDDITQVAKPDWQRDHATE
jgi:hypothetical protein